MSREALAKVIQRSISDGAFRRQLATDPTGALRGYELSSDEFAAIKSGDSKRLTALGVEQRMSKAFTLAGDAAGVDSVSKVVTSDLGATWSGALTASEGTAGGAALTPGDGASGTAAMTPNDAATGNAAFTTGSGTSGSAVLTPGDGVSASGALIDDGAARGSGALATGGESDTDAVIADVSGAARDAAIIPGQATHALGDEIDPGYAPEFHVVTPTDSEASNVIVSDEAGSGASTPGEALGGPNISQ